MNVKLRFFCFIEIIILTSCACNKQQDCILPKNPFISPALTHTNVAFSEYTIQAEKADTIIHSSGSILVFPPNAFVDENGFEISGKVQVKYRTFFDAVDFFMSGIPMDYEMEGVNYIFQSAGMCEIQAIFNGKDVFINQNRKPEIYLPSEYTDTLYNVYFLDQEQEKWLPKGKDLVQANDCRLDPVTAYTSIPEEPIMPRKAVNENRVFTIVIEEGSVPELQIYNNLKFEIADKNQKIAEEDTNVEWEGIKIKKYNSDGLYTVIFSKGNRNLEYQVRPVFEGKYYDEAMLVFENKLKEYRKAVQERREKEKEIQEKNKMILKMNKLIMARNRKIDRENKRLILKRDSMIALNKRLEEAYEQEREKINLRNREIQELNKRLLKDNAIKSRTSVFRSFRVDGLGIWNIDHPVLKTGIRIHATFVNQKGQPLNPKNLTVVYKGVNGIARFSNNHIILNTTTENSIWGVVDGKFVYMPFKDYKMYTITEDTKASEFKMHEHNSDSLSIDEIKIAIGLFN